jgi:hypothetical protein
LFKEDIKTPQSFYCSLTQQIMCDQVFTSNGFTYERDAIEKWIETHDTEPQIGAKLTNKNCIYSAVP